jgi:arylsulfatase A-like enzyme
MALPPNILRFLLRGVLALAVLAPAASRAAARPNIVFIMTDDHASHALSCYGSRVNQTPQLDRLAAGGVRFSNAFVTNSICTPSRATLLTGKYSHLNGTPVFNTFNGEQQHVAKLLQAGGYHTAMVGKWHLGSAPTGFDHWKILPGQGRYRDPILYDNQGAKVYEGYASDVITDLGIAALNARPKDRPFFLMLHHKAPHREWEPDEKNRALFANRTIPEPATLRDDYATRPAALPENAQTVFKHLTRRDLKLEAPPELAGPKRNQWLGVMPDEVEVEVDGTKRTLKGEELERWKFQRYMKDYLACVQGVDDNVGRFLDWLAAEGLAANTLVIYTSDNGFYLGDHGMYDKRFMYEPSLRVPLLAAGPGVKPGQVTEAFALNVDFAPTFLEVAGLEIPPGHARALTGGGARRQAAWRLAQEHVLQVLPRPRTPQHPRALRRPHRHPQADPLLEKGRMGAVRPAGGSGRAEESVRHSRQ